MDDVVDDFHGVGTRFDARIVSPCTIAEPEAPGMPGTGDDTAFDVSSSQGSSGVRATIIDCEVLATVAEDSDIALADFHHFGKSFRDFADSGNGNSHAHGSPIESLYSSIMAMLEIELKFVAPAGIEERFAILGAVPKGSHVENDHYYNAPDRDFAITNEAFRIRDVNGQCSLTYKGPRQSGLAKTRLEAELRVMGELSTVKTFVDLLGYRAVAVVEKHRNVWNLNRDGFTLAFCLDNVKNVGQFVEVEIVTEDQLKEKAETTLLNICSELHLSVSEPRSYLKMTLEKKSL